jgi:hypothetical protein
MRLVRPFRPSIYALAALLAISFGSSGSEPAEIPPRSESSYSTRLSLHELKRMSASELEQLFARGQAAILPVGTARGHVLLRTTAKFPRMRARMSGLVWKGKVFEGDGEFTNQWVGFQAIRSQARIDTSWLDGQPCIVLEYAPGTPLFGNTRDELREIAPGQYLGRFYERCPCPRLQGYFVLELETCCR